MWIWLDLRVLWIPVPVLYRGSLRENKAPQQCLTNASCVHAMPIVDHALNFIDKYLKASSNNIPVLQYLFSPPGQASHWSNLHAILSCLLRTGP